MSDIYTKTWNLELWWKKWSKKTTNDVLLILLHI